MCALSYWLGIHHSSKEAFDRGVKLEGERTAWIRATESNVFVRLLDSGRTEELRGFLVNGMWISIVLMDELIENPDASPEERKAASNILADLVEYFQNNPKKIVAPEGVKIADDVDRGLREKENSNGINPTKKKALGELREAAKAPMEQMDNMFSEVRNEAHKFDLATQTVLSRHILKRNFPGETRSAAGVTFKIPSGSGGSVASSDEFRYNGKKMSVLYKAGALRVNDQDFGKVAKGDIVDLRLLGHVYVNDIERHPEKKEAPQVQERSAQPATRPEPKSEGAHKPQPESEGRSR